MFKFHDNLTRVTAALHKDLPKIMVATRWIRDTR